MNPNDWLTKMRNELDTLMSNGTSRPDDAWRATVLIARLLNAPNQHRVQLDYIAQLPALVEAAGPSDFGRILRVLADSLEGDEPPEGPLLDSLLDVDDAASVSALEDCITDAEGLVRRSAAMVSLYPERTLGLTDFAGLRLQTIRSDSAAAELWRAVEASAAELLVAELPSSAAPPRIEPSRGVARVVQFTLPESSYAAAADSDDDTDHRGSSTDVEYVLEVVDGERQLEILAPRGSSIQSVSLECYDIQTEQVLESALLTLTCSGDRAYASCGPASGPGSLLHRIALPTGTNDGQAAVRLVVTLG